MNKFLLEAFVLEAAESAYYPCLWLFHNNYVLQVYSHAATLTLM